MLLHIEQLKSCTQSNRHQVKTTKGQFMVLKAKKVKRVRLIYGQKDISKFRHFGVILHSDRSHQPFTIPRNLMIWKIDSLFHLQNYCNRLLSVLLESNRPLPPEMYLEPGEVITIVFRIDLNIWLCCGAVVSTLVSQREGPGLIPSALKPPKLELWWRKMFLFYSWKWNGCQEVKQRNIYWDRQ